MHCMRITQCCKACIDADRSFWSWKCRNSKEGDKPVFRYHGAIVQAGSKAISPNEKFYVKVIQTAKADYVHRDIEFASAGALVCKLAKINALPAKSEQEADRVVLAVVGSKSAYVC